MSSSRRTPKIRRIGIVLAGLTLLLIGLGVFANSDAPPQASTEGSAETTSAVPHFWNSEERRTIVIAPAGEVYPPKGDVLTTTLVEGALPSDARHARVRTDTDCAPDQNGISHCLNELAIGDETVVVRHHHRMHAVPCLSPGETVRILEASAFRALAS